MNDSRQDDALRRAFRELPAAPAGDCPSSDQLAASARGESDPATFRVTIDHLAHCGACATAWVVVRAAAVSDTERTAPTMRRAWRRTAAAAVLAAVAVGAGWWWLGEMQDGFGDTDPVHRAVTPEAPTPEFPLEILGPPWELGWSPGLDGTTYDVHLSTPELDLLHRALGLRDTNYRIPEEALPAIRSENIVVWQIVAHQPDGEQHSSRSVVVQVVP